MIKKLAHFVLCFAPISAMADVVSIANPYGGNLNIASTNDGVVVTTGSLNSLSVTGAISAAGKLWVGANREVASYSGDIYTTDSIGTAYSVTAGGNISFNNGVNIADGYSLTIGGGTAPVALNLGTGILNVDGEFHTANVNTISVGQFIANGTGDNSVDGTAFSANGTGGVVQINDSASLTIDVGSGTFSVANGSVENNSTGTLEINAGVITAKNLTNASNSGNLVIDASSLNVTGGDSSTTASIVNKGDFTATISGATTLAHGFDLSTMNATNSFYLYTGTLSLGDRFDTFYSNNLSSFMLTVIDGDIDTNGSAIRNGLTNSSALMDLFTYYDLVASEIQNLAGLNIIADNISVTGANGIMNDAGTMNLSASGTIASQKLMVNDGLVNVYGVFSGLNDLYAVGGIYQNGAPTTDGSIKFSGANYTLGATNVNVGRVVQNGASDSFVLNTDNLTVGAGGIDVRNFTVKNLSDANGVDITVGGNVSNGLSIIGLESMTIGGDYNFNDSSRLLFVANPESSGYNYWSTASFGAGVNIVNSYSATPLIMVGNDLVLNVTNSDYTGVLLGGQFGIDLRQSVDETSAIWLMRVDGATGVDQYTNLIKNLAISFCNADGSVCAETLDSDLLPAFLMAYDTDNDGINESIYVVFDNPNGIFPLQPVVAVAPEHTQGEWDSAGALDDLIAHQLTLNGFSYDSPLSVIKGIFADTPLSRVDEELYVRMNDYTRRHNPAVIENFARLFQLREANQIANSLSLNTHTVFRDMSDRFIDESIWNRHRRLNKLWIDADYAMITDDLENIDGDSTRFSLSLGYDWQTSETLILGWFGHVSHTNSTVDDNIDLSYGSRRGIAGRVETDMTNLGVGGGLYFVKTLNNKLRLYGDAMVNFNMIDVERNQTWVDKITGDATTFGVNAEFGLIHDWLNQYIIGNLYARAGYDFGFDMTEKVGGTDYMNLDFDGHIVLTPGYSLTAQKRVYPSAWFEFRPNATVGVEYDVLGAPDTMKYKFAVVDSWTDYDIEIDPLWLNAGVGVEFLSVNGLHVGLGYRYQYNADMQMHKVQASAKYRF